MSTNATSNDVAFDLANDLVVGNSITVGSSLLGTNGLTIAGGPSVTTAGIDAGGMTITDVAAGVAATDAVNVSQLTDATTGVTAAGMNFTGNDNSAGDVHRDLGQTLAIQGAATTAGTYSGGNIRTVTDPATGAVNIELADAPTFGTVTVNDGGSGRITGVTAGIAATDAVNVSQLADATTAVQTHYYSVNDGGVTGGNYDNDGASGLNALAAGVDATAAGAGATALGMGARPAMRATSRWALARRRPRRSRRQARRSTARPTPSPAPPRPAR